MIDPAIEISGLSKVFATRRTEVTALSSVDLSIREGEFVTLFGPSGCGKSTLLRILASLEDATDGDVRVLGDTPKGASAKKNIAWMPQTSALLPWLDVRGNADLSKVVNRKADSSGRTSRIPENAVQMLEEMGLGDFIGAQPTHLSGGMRQRAAIARGFVQGSPVLLMDEPFSALDELTRDTLRMRLLDLWERHRRTIVFVTHSAAEAVLLSDRVVVMTPRPGRIQQIIRVDFARPRDAGLIESAAFTAKVGEVKRALNSGWTGEES